MQGWVKVRKGNTTAQRSVKHCLVWGVFLPLFLHQKAPKIGAFLSEGCHFKVYHSYLGCSCPKLPLPWIRCCTWRFSLWHYDCLTTEGQIGRFSVWFCSPFCWNFILRSLCCVNLLQCTRDERTLCCVNLLQCTRDERTFSVRVQSWSDEIKSDPVLIRKIFENHQSDPVLIGLCKKRYSHFA